MARIFLIKIYLRTYGKYRLCFGRILTIGFQSLISFLPSDMLIFFGYEGSHKYEVTILNFAWLRRIISSVRLTITLFAIDGLLADQFITTVFCFYFFYLAVLLTAICPSASNYDASSWYRKA